MGDGSEVGIVERDLKDKAEMAVSINGRGFWVIRFCEG